MQSPFRMVCRNFILPELCKLCLFFFLRNLFYLILYSDEDIVTEINLWSKMRYWASRAFVYTNAQNGLPALPPEIRFCLLGSIPNPLNRPFRWSGCAAILPLFGYRPLLIFRSRLRPRPPNVQLIVNSIQSGEINQSIADGTADLDINCEKDSYPDSIIPSIIKING